MDEEIAEIERKLPSHFSSFSALNNADSQEKGMLFKSHCHAHLQLKSLLSDTFLVANYLPRRCPLSSRHRHKGHAERGHTTALRQYDDYYPKFRDREVSNG